MAALSKISEIGGVIQGDWIDEQIITAVADSAGKAGHICGLTDAGVVDLIHTTNHDEFIGILLPHHKMDMDTIIGAGKIVSIVVPQDGHLYGCICADLNSSLPGNVVGYGGTAGTLVAVAAIEGLHDARTYKYTDGDTVGIFIWGP